MRCLKKTAIPHPPSQEAWKENPGGRGWIKKLQSMIPYGFNSSSASRNSFNRGKNTIVDDRRFSSINEMARSISDEFGLTFEAVKIQWKRGKRSLKELAAPLSNKWDDHSQKNTAAWRRWSHAMKCHISGKALMASEWHDFDRWYNQVGHMANETTYIIRKKRSKPLGPDNYRLSQHKPAQPKEGTPIVVFGVKYESMRDACAANNISHQTVNSRMRERGITLEDAIRLGPAGATLPPRK